MNARGKLRFWLDAALAALFLGALFALGAATLLTDGGGISSAFTARRRVLDFLDDPANSGPWDYFAAQIRSLDDYLGDHLSCIDALRRFNANFQFALGKELIQTGDRRMLRLTTGQFCDLQFERKPMADAARGILRLRAALPPNTPFLFAYCHPTLYDEANQLPEGYAAFDQSGETADELLALLEAQGVPLLDSRDVLRESGLSPSQYLLRTDNHWATRAALEMARGIAREAAGLTGAALQPERLDIARFDAQTYPALFLGSYGQRVGPANAAPDDITIYWPRYPTELRRRTFYLGERTDVTGPFRDSVIRWRYLRRPEGQSWNTMAYFDYGLTENWDLYENPDAADCTILLLKDSYSAAIGSFLSLVADKVCAVDLRRNDQTLQQWIDQTDPDLVIAAYSLPLLLGE